MSQSHHRLMASVFFISKTIKQIFWSVAIYYCACLHTFPLSLPFLLFTKLYLYLLILCTYKQYYTAKFQWGSMWWWELTQKYKKFVTSSFHIDMCLEYHCWRESLYLRKFILFLLLLCWKLIIYLFSLVTTWCYVPKGNLLRLLLLSWQQKSEILKLF